MKNNSNGDHKVLTEEEAKALEEFSTNFINHNLSAEDLDELLYWLGGSDMPTTVSC